VDPLLAASHRPLPAVNRNPGTHRPGPTGSPVSPDAPHRRIQSRLACDGGARASAAAPNSSPRAWVSAAWPILLPWQAASMHPFLDARASPPR